jgi:Protein of unknown function (DUF812)
MKIISKSGSAQLRAEVERTIEDLRLVVTEIRSKEDLVASLQGQVEAIPATALSRSFYTQRILSIVANVKKQNEEMNRVLEDVKSVQREINTLQGKVGRTYTVTDEMIFRVRSCCLVELFLGSFQQRLEAPQIESKTIFVCGNQPE